MRKWINISSLSVLLVVFSTWILCAQTPRPQRPPIFKVDVDMVFVNVAVSDPLNRYVTGLEKENFKIFEDKVEQEIIHFNQYSAPISIGIIFDISGSMKENANIARFLDFGNTKDEYLLITFNQQTKLVRDFSQQVSTLQSDILFQKPGGNTSLYDAVYMGLSYVMEGTNEKKALILITDGEDNTSRYSPGEIREFAKESSVQIYSIGQIGAEGYGMEIIRQLVSITGGRAFFPSNFNELDYYIDLIHAELRNQYVLGYRPSNRMRDGKWRHIKVTLDTPAGIPKLKIHAREGYYAPKF